MESNPNNPTSCPSFLLPFATTPSLHQTRQQGRSRSASARGGSGGGDDGEPAAAGPDGHGSGPRICGASRSSACRRKRLPSSAFISCTSCLLCRAIASPGFLIQLTACPPNPDLVVFADPRQGVHAHLQGPRRRAHRRIRAAPAPPLVTQLPRHHPLQVRACPVPTTLKRSSFSPAEWWWLPRTFL